MSISSPELTPAYLMPHPILGPDMLFGRKGELATIFCRPKHMSSVSTSGQWHTGKGYALFHPAQGVRARLGDGFTSADLDVRLVTIACEFHEKLLGELDEGGNAQQDLQRWLTGRQVIACLEEFEKLFASSVGSPREMQEKSPCSAPAAAMRA